MASHSSRSGNTSASERKQPQHQQHALWGAPGQQVSQSTGSGRSLAKRRGSTGKMGADIGNAIVKNVESSGEGTDALGDLDRYLSRHPHRRSVETGEGSHRGGSSDRDPTSIRSSMSAGLSRPRPSRSQIKLAKKIAEESAPPPVLMVEVATTDGPTSSGKRRSGNRRRRSRSGSRGRLSVTDALMMEGSGAGVGDVIPTMIDIGGGPKQKLPQRGRSAGAATGQGRRTRSVSVGRRHVGSSGHRSVGAMERSYMVMIRAIDGDDSGSGNDKEGEDIPMPTKGSALPGPPTSISIIRSNSFGKLSKRSTELMLDHEDKVEDKDGPEKLHDSSKSAPNLKVGKKDEFDTQDGDESGAKGERKQQRHTSMQHSSSSVRSRDSGSDLWDSFKSGRRKPSTESFANPYLSYEYNRKTAAASTLSRKHHSDGKLNELILDGIGSSDDDDDDNDYDQSGRKHGRRSERGDNRQGRVRERLRSRGPGERPRAYSDKALERALQMGLLDTEDVDEVVNAVEESLMAEALKVGYLDEDNGFVVDEVRRSQVQDRKKEEYEEFQEPIPTEYEIDIKDEDDDEEERRPRTARPRRRHSLGSGKTVENMELAVSNKRDNQRGAESSRRQTYREGRSIASDGPYDRKKELRRRHSDGKLNSRAAAAAMFDDEDCGDGGAGGGNDQGGDRRDSTRNRWRGRNAKEEGERRLRTRRHSDGTLNVGKQIFDALSDDGEDEEREFRGRSLKNPGGRRRISQENGSRGALGIKMNRLQALENSAMRNVISGERDHGPPMTIVVGDSERPEPSSRWGKDGCKVLSMEDPQDLDEKDNTRMPRRKSLEQDKSQEVALKKGPYEMYLLGVQRMEERRPIIEKGATTAGETKPRRRRSLGALGSSAAGGLGF